MAEFKADVPPLSLPPDHPRVFELQTQVGKMEIVLNNPYAKRVTFMMLGDRKRAFIPPHRWFGEFKKLLEDALKDPGDRVVISHPFLSVLQVDLPTGPVVITSPTGNDRQVQASALEQAARELRGLEAKGVLGELLALQIKDWSLIAHGVASWLEQKAEEIRS